MLILFFSFFELGLEFVCGCLVIVGFCEWGVGRGEGFWEDLLGLWLLEVCKWEDEFIGCVELIGVVMFCIFCWVWFDINGGLLIVDVLGWVLLFDNLRLCDGFG